MGRSPTGARRSSFFSTNAAGTCTSVHGHRTAAPQPLRSSTHLWPGTHRLCIHPHPLPSCPLPVAPWSQARSFPLLLMYQNQVPLRGRSGSSEALRLPEMWHQHENKQPVFSHQMESPLTSADHSSNGQLDRELPNSLLLHRFSSPPYWPLFTTSLEPSLNSE